MRELVREYGGGSSGFGGSGGDESHDGGGGKKGSDKTEDEPEIDEDVQLVNKGDVHCIRCNKDLSSTLHLKNHVKLYHKNVYKFKCEICDKGFQSIKGFREHQKIHKGSKLKCSQCEKDFTTDRVMQWHIKEHHGEKKNLKCPHCDHISHTKATI